MTTTTRAVKLSGDMRYLLAQITAMAEQVGCRFIPDERKIAAFTAGRAALRSREGEK